MTQKQYQTSGAGLSQAAAVLQTLKERRGWVPMIELARASGSFAVHSRISDLRSRGHIIEHQSGRVGRRVLSSYRLAR